MSFKKYKPKKLFKRHRILLARYLASHGFSEYSILVIFSIITGVGAGLFAVAFHRLIEFLNEFLFIKSHQRFGGMSYWLMFVPAIGMLIQYLMTHFAPKQASQKGVLHVIKAVALGRGHISPKTTAFHFLAPAICMGTGGTVGPEGPCAQIGAGASSFLGNLFALSESHRRIFTAAGAGAAIAAVFNAPMGGVFFALEVVLLNDFRTTTLIAFLLSSVSASTLSRALLGNDPNFIFGNLELLSIKFYFLYLVIGILAGLISVGYLFFDEWINIQYKRLYRHIPRWLGMISIGLLLGALGLIFPQLLGIGYIAINQILQNQLALTTVLILLVLKLILVPAILHAGGFGGTFAPSLFIGACFGFLFTKLASLTLGMTFQPTTFILIGMGAVLAGINSIPIAGIMIIFEMTNNYNFILPLMLAVGSSTVIVQMIIKNSIYVRKLSQEGFRYIMGRESHILRSLLVKEMMTKDILTVAENASLPDLVKICMTRPYQRIYTHDKDGNITGVIATQILNTMITDYHDLTHMMIIARDIADGDVFFVKESDNLDQVMHQFARKRVEEFPVLSDDYPMRAVGLIRQQDIIDAYNAAVIKFNLSNGLANELKMIEKDQLHDVLPGFSTVEAKVPKTFIGQSLAKLKIRNRFNVDIIMVEKSAQPFYDQSSDVDRFMPNVNYRFHEGDNVIVFGKKEDIINFKNFCMAN